MIDVLLPRTDAGVAAQALLVFPVLLAALVVLRHEAEWRMLVVGLLVFGVAAFALRALH